MVQNDGKQKKKKEKTMKEKQLGAEVIKGDENAVQNANGIDQNSPSEADKPRNEKWGIVITLTCQIFECAY